MVMWGIFFLKKFFKGKIFDTYSDMILRLFNNKGDNGEKNCQQFSCKMYFHVVVDSGGSPPFYV